MTIGERIRAVRKEHRMSMETLGKKIGLRAATISLIERDRYRPTDRTIHDLCRLFGLSREWLVNGTGAKHEIAESSAQIARSFRDVLEYCPGIMAMAKLAFSRMTPLEWKQLDLLMIKLLGEPGASSREHTGERSGDSRHADPT